MKYIFLLGLLITSFVKSYAGDLTTVQFGGGTSSIVVPDGKILEIVSFPSGGNFTYTPSSISGPGFAVYGNQFTAGSAGSCKLVGPGVLAPNTNYIGLTYRLVDNISTTTTTPTSSVVIPTDATGPVKIVLESSTDLVTWTEANPGTYGASTTKRFFRVRAVNQ